MIHAGRHGSPADADGSISRRLSVQPDSLDEPPSSGGRGSARDVSDCLPDPDSAGLSGDGTGFLISAGMRGADSTGIRVRGSAVCGPAGAGREAGRGSFMPAICPVPAASGAGFAAAGGLRASDAPGG